MQNNVKNEYCLILCNINKNSQNSILEEKTCTFLNSSYKSTSASISNMYALYNVTLAQTTIIQVGKLTDKDY